MSPAKVDGSMFVVRAAEEAIQDAVRSLVDEVDNTGLVEDAVALNERIANLGTLLLRLGDRSTRHVEFLKVRVFP